MLPNPDSIVASLGNGIRMIGLRMRRRVQLGEFKALQGRGYRSRTCLPGPLALILMLALPAVGQDLDRQLAAAAHREAVSGDLAGAVDAYRGVLAQAGSNRAVAATALLGIAQCQEKLGQRKQARATYTQVVREYADQARAAATARSRLAGWTDAAPGPRNLAFDEDSPGRMPPGWFSPSLPGAEATVESRKQGCHGTHGCAVVRGNGPRAGILMQSFSAAAYRGKTIRVRASMRIDPAQGDDRGTLWLRVDRGNGHPGNADTTDRRPVRSGTWTAAEVITEVDADAQFLELGVTSVGQGRVWVDDLSFEVVPKAEIDAARDAVAAHYLGIDAALEQGTFDAASVLAAGAPFRVYGQESPLADALLPNSYPSYQTTIAGFRLSGEGAVAVVRSEFGPSGPGGMPGMSKFRDAWVRGREGWRLRERVFLAGHYRERRTDAQSAKLVAADLKALAAPLAIVEAGHSFYDLAPFSHAIGEASIVALGGAAEGVHEGQRLRHRLLEYLVKERGFRVLALSANGLDGEVVNHYIQTGEGDPRVALLQWSGATQELLDAVEWMRTYNRTQGSRGMLSLAVLPHCDQTNAATVTSARPCLPEALADGLQKVVEKTTGKQIILWADNSDIPLLRPRFGRRLYAAGFALQKGEIQAVGYTGGLPTGPGRFAVPRSADGAGDAVLGSAGMPLFFLDLHSVPDLTTLGLWLVEPHLFLSVRGVWNRDDPENHLHPAVLSDLYDGLIFIAEGHAAQPIEASPPSTGTR